MDEEMKKGQQCGALLIFFSGSHVPSLMTGMNAIMTVSAPFQYQFCLCFYSTLALYFSVNIEYAVHGSKEQIENAKKYLKLAGAKKTFVTSSYTGEGFDAFLKYMKEMDSHA